MNEYTYEATAEEVIADIDEEVSWALEENPALSREDVIKDIAEAILRELPQRGLKAQIRRRLGI